MTNLTQFKNTTILGFAKIYSQAHTGVQNVLVNLSKNLNRPLNRPTVITLIVTNNCMLRCQQCDLWKTLPDKKPLTFKEAKIIIDRLHSWLGNFYLHFSGGEPFLNHDLLKMIEYADKKGITTHITSNAYIFNPVLIKKIIASRLSSLSISLDGATAGTHDRLRGVKGAYGKVISSLKWFRQFDPSHRLKIYLNTVIMRPNVKQLSQIVNIAAQNHVDGLTFQNLLPNLDSGKSVNDQVNSRLWPKYLLLKKSTGNLIKNIPNTPVLHTTKSDLIYTQNYYKNPHITDQFQCAAGINDFIVNHRGGVRLCHSFPPIGNIFKTDPKSIWHGDTAQKQRPVIRKCLQPCKMTVCNQVNTERQKYVILKSFQ